MNKILEGLSTGEILVADGATGPNLQKMGLKPGPPPEDLLIDSPDLILKLASSFVEGGSDIILTCTFGGTRKRMKDSKYQDRAPEVNIRAAEIARQAASARDGVLVAGSLGPVGALIKPYGPLEAEDVKATFAEQAKALAEGGVDLLLIETMGKICGIYVNSALAKTEAWENGFDEAILLTQDGHVSEGSGENIFLVSGGRLITPPSSDNILMGITRDTVMKLARNELGIDTIERLVDRSELNVADECFFTGTAANMAPILEIDHRPISSGKIGKVTAKLQKLFVEVMAGRNAKYTEWYYLVPPKTVKA